MKKKLVIFSKLSILVTDLGPQGKIESEIILEVLCAVAVYFELCTKSDDSTHIDSYTNKNPYLFL